MARPTSNSSVVSMTESSSSALSSNGRITKCDTIKHTMRKRASFSTVTVREYTQTLGDNPSCQTGAPITLGWEYQEKESEPLDDYEESRQQSRRSDLILGAYQRRQILLQNGLLLLEIIRAERIVGLKHGATPVAKQFQSCALLSQMKSQRQCMVSLSSKRSLVSRAA